MHSYQCHVNVKQAGKRNLVVRKKKSKPQKAEEQLYLWGKYWYFEGFFFFF